MGNRGGSSPPSRTIPHARRTDIVLTTRQELTLEDITMKLEMTELGPIKRALKIEVPEEEVNRQFAQAYSELNRQVRIPGFRPGKAPLASLGTTLCQSRRRRRHSQLDPRLLR